MGHFRMYLMRFIISCVVVLLFSAVMGTERCPDGSFQWFECQPGRTRCPRSYYCHHDNGKTKGICCPPDVFKGGECPGSSIYEGRTCNNERICSHGFYCNRMPFTSIGFCCSF